MMNDSYYLKKLGVISDSYVEWFVLCEMTRYNKTFLMLSIYVFFMINNKDFLLRKLEQY